MIPGINREISEYLGRHPEDRPRLELLLEQVMGSYTYGDRTNMAGHVVSSVITLDKSRKMALLIHHLAYGLWIPPGGHYENDGSSLYRSALRERAEETGLKQSRGPGGSPYLLDIDTHPIPARPEKGEGPHFHHDFMYLELLDVDFEPEIQESEVSGADWKPLADMLREEGRMARLASRILSLPADFLI